MDTIARKFDELVLFGALTAGDFDSSTASTS